MPHAALPLTMAQEPGPGPAAWQQQRALGDHDSRDPLPWALQASSSRCLSRQQEQLMTHAALPLTMAQLGERRRHLPVHMKPSGPRRGDPTPSGTRWRGGVIGPPPESPPPYSAPGTLAAARARPNRPAQATHPGPAAWQQHRALVCGVAWSSSFSPAFLERHAPHAAHAHVSFVWSAAWPSSWHHILSGDRG